MPCPGEQALTTVPHCLPSTQLLQVQPTGPCPSGQPSWPAMRPHCSCCSCCSTCSARSSAPAGPGLRRRSSVGCSSCCRPRWWRQAKSRFFSRWLPRRAWLGRRRARQATLTNCPRHTGGGADPHLAWIGSPGARHCSGGLSAPVQLHRPVHSGCRSALHNPRNADPSYCPAGA